MFKKYGVPVIGVAAFVIGGLVARDRAFEIVEIVEKALDKKPKLPAND